MSSFCTGFDSTRLTLPPPPPLLTRANRGLLLKLLLLPRSQVW